MTSHIGKRNSVVLLAILLLTFMMACSRKQAPAGPATFVGSFQPGSSIQQITDQLKAKGIEPQIGVQSLAKEDPRPKFDFGSMRVEKYTDRGVSGRMGLYFFNDRLLSATFYPDDAAKYEKELGYEFKDEEAVKLSDRVNLRKTANMKGQTYFLWEDKPLQEEVAAWMQKYAKPINNDDVQSAANSGANPHASGMGPAKGTNPHAGMNMGGASGTNPHAGMMTGGAAGANPHAGGMEMQSPHGNTAKPQGQKPAGHP